MSLAGATLRLRDPDLQDVARVLHEDLVRVCARAEHLLARVENGPAASERRRVPRP